MPGLVAVKGNQHLDAFDLHFTNIIRWGGPFLIEECLSVCTRAPVLQKSVYYFSSGDHHVHSFIRWEKQEAETIPHTTGGRDRKLYLDLVTAK